MGNEILRDSRQDTLKDIPSITITLAFQVGFAQQSIGINMLREGLKNMAGMGDRLFIPTTLDLFFDLLNVIS
jgi:hypothetical protein